MSNVEHIFERALNADEAIGNEESAALSRMSSLAVDWIEARVRGNIGTAVAISGQVDEQLREFRKAERRRRREEKKARVRG